MVSFSRVVKEEVVFNDFESCCQRAMLCAVIKINGTLSLSNHGLSLTIRTENAKIASKIHKMLKEEYDPQIEFLVSRKMKLKKNNVYILIFGQILAEEFHNKYSSAYAKYQDYGNIRSEADILA